MNEDKMELEEAIKHLEQCSKLGIAPRKETVETVLKSLEITQKNYELAIKQNISYKQNIKDLKENSIPKKKIEDKILQEWQKCPKNSINDFAITERNNKIEGLQELLEDK